MNLKEMKSALEMHNLYFSRCAIERNQKVSDKELNASITREVTELMDHVFAVKITVEIQNEDLQVEVVANAEFTYRGDDLTLEEVLIKKNTLAIMFPFIRSQVSLLTTQPGMQPIILPPINTSKFED